VAAIQSESMTGDELVMKQRLQSIVCATSWMLALFPSLALAHQPRLVTDGSVEITNPEVSRAFYGELKGAPATFRIHTDREFRLYVGLLVPDLAGVQKDISADITRITPIGNQQVALLDGRASEWTPFFEEFAKDHYLWGPEFTADTSLKGVTPKGRMVAAGTYVITVFSPENRGKYSLAVGDQEEFPLEELVHGAVTVLRIKAQFFGYSPLAILASPFGWGYLLVVYSLAFAVGLTVRTFMRKCAKTAPITEPHNIGLPDRLLRAAFGFALLVWAITTSWNPILVFVSGLCVFEATCSWCGLYAALGKHSCPLNSKGYHA
jgi:hypothetical protein